MIPTLEAPVVSHVKVNRLPVAISSTSTVNDRMASAEVAEGGTRVGRAVTAAAVGLGGAVMSVGDCVAAVAVGSRADEFVGTVVAVAGGTGEPFGTTGISVAISRAGPVVGTLVIGVRLATCPILVDGT